MKRVIFLILFLLCPAYVYADCYCFDINHVTPLKIEYKSYRVIRAMAYRFLRKHIRRYVNDDRELAFQATMSPGLFLREYPILGFSKVPFSRGPLFYYRGIEVSEDLRFRVNVKELLGLRDIFRSPRGPPKKLHRVIRPRLVGSNAKFRLNISFDRQRFVKSLGTKISKTYQYYAYKITVQVYARHDLRDRDSQVGFEIRVI